MVVSGLAVLLVTATLVGAQGVSGGTIAVRRQRRIARPGNTDSAVALRRSGLRVTGIGGVISRVSPVETHCKGE
jgi:hypothetical protein